MKLNLLLAAVATLSGLTGYSGEGGCALPTSLGLSSEGLHYTIAANLLNSDFRQAYFD